MSLVEQALSRIWNFSNKETQDELWGAIRLIAAVGLLPEDDITILISLYIERRRMEEGEISSLLMYDPPSSFVRIDSFDLIGLHPDLVQEAQK